MAPQIPQPRKRAVFIIMPSMDFYWKLRVGEQFDANTNGLYEHKDELFVCGTIPWPMEMKTTYDEQILYSLCMN